MGPSLPLLPMLDDDSITSTVSIHQKIKPKKSRSNSRMQWDDSLQRGEAIPDYNDNTDYQDEDDFIFYRRNEKQAICNIQRRNGLFEYAMDSREARNNHVVGTQMLKNTRASKPFLMQELHSSSPVFLGTETFFVTPTTKFALQPRFSFTTRKAMHSEVS
jgi:hypothetical protein